MALILDRKTETGIPIKYHRIAQINTYRDLAITVTSYIDKSYSDLEKLPESEGKVFHIQIKVYFYPLDKTEDINYAVIYEQLKLLPDFEGAIDG